MRKTASDRRALEYIAVPGAYSGVLSAGSSESTQVQSQRRLERRIEDLAQQGQAEQVANQLARDIEPLVEHNQAVSTQTADHALKRCLLAAKRDGSRHERERQEPTSTLSIRIGLSTKELSSTCRQEAKQEVGLSVKESMSNKGREH